MNSVQFIVLSSFLLHVETLPGCSSRFMRALFSRTYSLEEWRQVVPMQQNVLCLRGVSTIASPVFPVSYTQRVNEMH
jgi:hypothetical protein